MSLYYMHTPGVAITVVLDAVPFTVAADNSKYDRIVEALSSGDHSPIEGILKEKADLSELVGVFGAVTVYNGHVEYDGAPLHNYVVQKILDKPIDVAPLANFLDRVKGNPSRRAVEDLYKWCEASKMPLTTDGRILAYKIVGPDFLDLHSKSFDNSPGKTVEMPRNEVDEDPNQTCSHGLHFCGASYLPHYGTGANSKVVLIAVDPADVVAFPVDYHLQKARCCRYEVLQEIDREKSPEFFSEYLGYWPVKEDLVIVRDTRDDTYVTDVDDAGCANYVDTRPEPMRRADAEAMISRANYSDYYEIISAPTEPEPQPELVYLIDSDGEYVIASGDHDYAYSVDKPAPMTRAEAERLKGVSKVGHRYKIVPAEELVFLRDDDRDYIFRGPNGGWNWYRGDADDQYLMTRAEAEALKAEFDDTSDRWEIVPQDENEAWTPS